MKEREYRLLEAISADESATQASLASHLGIAVGSVNWYIKRLIGRGYLKVTRMDRTRLRYNLTRDGMAAFTRNAMQYVKDSLEVYREVRNQAQETVERMRQLGIKEVYLVGSGDVIDIMRLTCIEAGISVSKTPGKWTVRVVGRRFEFQATSDDLKVGG